MEEAVVKRVIKSVDAPAPRMPGMPFTSHEPGTVEIESGLKYDHIAGVDVSCTGSGLGFEPATSFVHTSGDELRPLGTPFELERALDSKGLPHLALIQHYMDTLYRLQQGHLLLSTPLQAP